MDHRFRIADAAGLVKALARVVIVRSTDRRQPESAVEQILPERDSGIRSIRDPSIHGFDGVDVSEVGICYGPSATHASFARWRHGMVDGDQPMQRGHA